MVALATKSDLMAMEQRLQTELRINILRLTVRFGVMLTVASTALVAILKLT
jgi:hypothetical protein